MAQSLLTLRTRPASVRRIREADLPAVRRILRESGVFDPPDRKNIYAMVRDYFYDPEGNSLITLVHRDGLEITGFISFGVDFGEGNWEIYAAAVDARSRRGGVGRTLLAHAERTMRAKGARAAYLTTVSTPEYAIARRFWRRMGYVREAVLRDFYGAGQHRLIYGKRLRGRR